MSQRKKTGPKGPYAVKNALKNMSDDRKHDLRKKYYLERMTKRKLAKEVGISHALINDLIEELGPLQQLPQNSSDDSE